MKWFLDYKEDLKWAFDQAKAIVSRLEPPFDRKAQQYLSRFNLLEHEVPTNYICFLLPFWMEDLGISDRQVTRQMSLANLFAMMSYHLTDEAMDKPGAVRADILPLSALLHLEFTLQYSALFPTSSPFWNYYRVYLGEWALSVSEENKRDWLHENPVRMGHKAALVKLSSSGLLILGGREEWIPSVSNAVDQVLVVLQMLDDWKDWEKDLEEGSYNSLLSHMKSKMNFPAEYKLTSDEVRIGLYTYNFLSSYGQLAVQWQEPLEWAQHRLPQLHEFYRFLLNNLLEGGLQVEKEQKLLEGGGLQYFLTKNYKNS